MKRLKQLLFLLVFIGLTSPVFSTVSNSYHETINNANPNQYVAPNYSLPETGQSVFNPHTGEWETFYQNEYVEEERIFGDIYTSYP